MATSPEIRLREQVLAEAGWLQRMAQRLVRDAGEAEELVQRTMTQALSRGPERLERPRSWLYRVLHNTHLQGQREESRRSQREQAVAEQASVSAPEPWEALARIQLQEDLAAALRELPEPERSALVLRYFDQRSPAQIAARLGLRRRQVYGLLERGISRLRGRLDARHGSRRAWVTPLIPLLRSTPPLLPISLTMSTKPLLLGATALSLLALAVWQINRGGDPTPSTDRHESPRNLQAEGEAGVTRQSLPETRGTAGQGGPGVDPAPAGATLPVLVLDADAQPSPGVPLVSAPSKGAADNQGRTVAVSAADGRARLDAGLRGQTVHAQGEAHVTVFAATLTEARSAPVVVVAPPRQLRARLIDGLGAAVAGARVEVLLPENFRGRFSQVLDHSTRRSWVAVSDARGELTLGRLPRVAGSRVLVTHARFLPLRLDLPRAESGHTWTLQRPAVEAGSLAGVVLDRQGQPVAAAAVSMGEAATLSDAQGRFTFGAEQVDRSAPLMALQQGALPGILDPVPADQAFVTLRLGASPKELHGRVVDELGAPVSGAQVWVKTATTFDSYRGGAACVEGILAGGLARQELRDAYRKAPEGTSVRDFLASAQRADWPSVRSDAQGRFVLRGLMEREYQVVAMDPETLLRTYSPATAAGSRGLRLVLDQQQLFAEVRGRVVDRSGKPVPDATVAPQIDAFYLTIRRRGRAGRSTQHSSLPSTRSAEDGSFVLRRIPRQGVYLRIDGAEILPEEFGRGLEGGFVEAAQGLHLGFDLPVRRRLHVQLSQAGKRADSCRFVDAAGEVLVVNLFQGNSRRSFRIVGLGEERTPVFVVPDTAVRLELLQNGEKIDSIDLNLRSGEVNQIQL